MARGSARGEAGDADTNLYLIPRRALTRQNVSVQGCEYFMTQENEGIR